MTRTTTTDAGVWLLNVASAVGFIMVNKHLMDTEGLGYRFAVTLSALHILLSSLTAFAPQLAGNEIKVPRISRRDLLVLVIVGNASIVSINLSLMINTVSFYQVAKVMNVPFIYFVEWCWLGRQASASVFASIVMMTVGVGLVIVTDVDSTVTLLGFSVAGSGVVFYGMHQICCRYILQKNDLSAREVLLLVGIPQGLMLVVLGPPLDRLFSSQWVQQFTYTPMITGYIALSCVVAVFLKCTHVMILGRFSSLTYQVTGHTKASLVLICSATMLEEKFTLLKMLGVGIAILGMGLHSFVNTIETKRPPKPAQEKELDVIVLPIQKK